MQQLAAGFWHRHLVSLMRVGERVELDQRHQFEGARWNVMPMERSQAGVAAKREWQQVIGRRNILAFQPHSLIPPCPLHHLPLPLYYSLSYSHSVHGYTHPWILGYVCSTRVESSFVSLVEERVWDNEDTRKYIFSMTEVCTCHRFHWPLHNQNAIWWVNDKFVDTPIVYATLEKHSIYLQLNVIINAFACQTNALCLWIMEIHGEKNNNRGGMEKKSPTENGNKIHSVQIVLMRVNVVWCESSQCDPRP